MNQLNANNNNQITEIPISKLHAFEGHPYKVEDNEEMDALVESIRKNGIMTPLIVRPIYGVGEYEVISGHRRLHAAKKAGINEVPAFVHNIDRDKAAIELVDCNLHREHLLPSEKAFAYKLKLEAIKHQGVASRQVVGKSESADMISDTESGRTVQRYIRLTHLIRPLLDLMDEGKMALSVGVELSYLDENSQRHIAEIAKRDEITPSYSQAVRLHRDSNDGLFILSAAFIESVLSEPKPNQRETVRIRADRLREVLPSSVETDRAEDFILKACEHYRKYLERQRDAR
ncbi:MAG: ParB/RepB/Spo0J family partition protein [Oscillospiraceae bacterium]|nr:ParB/RepB/Spo0J family partition protein [Oscillospiraceae bacterium]